MHADMSLARSWALGALGLYGKPWESAQVQPTSLSNPFWACEGCRMLLDPTQPPLRYSCMLCYEGDSLVSVLSIGLPHTCRHKVRMQDHPQDP